MAHLLIDALLYGDPELQASKGVAKAFGLALKLPTDDQIITAVDNAQLSSWDEDYACKSPISQ